MRRAQSSGAVPAPSCGLARPLLEPTEEAVDVGHGREVLGGQALPFPGERDPVRHRHDRGADDAGIDQLLAPQSLPVGIALVLYPSPAEADEIGGGAADVDEHPALGLQRGKGGARMPVRRGHIEGMVPGPCRAHKAPAAGIDQDAMATEAPHHVAHQCPRAFLAVTKAVGQLSGHGERVAPRVLAEPGGQGSEGLLEPIQARRHGTAQTPASQPAASSPALGGPDVPARDHGGGVVTGHGSRRPPASSCLSRSATAPVGELGRRPRGSRRRRGYPMLSRLER